MVHILIIYTINYTLIMLNDIVKWFSVESFWPSLTLTQESKTAIWLLRYFLHSHSHAYANTVTLHQKLEKTLTEENEYNMREIKSRPYFLTQADIDAINSAITYIELNPSMSPTFKLDFLVQSVSSPVRHHIQKIRDLFG